MTGLPPVSGRAAEEDDAVLQQQVAERHRPLAGVVAALRHGCIGPAIASGSMADAGSMRSKVFIRCLEENRFAIVYGSSQQLTEWEMKGERLNP